MKGHTRVNATAGQASEAGVRAADGVLLTIAVILKTLNLRPAITSVGPLLGEMRTSMVVGASASGPVS